MCTECSLRTVKQTAVLEFRKRFKQDSNNKKQPLSDRAASVYKEADLPISVQMTFIMFL